MLKERPYNKDHARAKGSVLWREKLPHECVRHGARSESDGNGGKNKRGNKDDCLSCWVS